MIQVHNSICRLAEELLEYVGCAGDSSDTEEVPAEVPEREEDEQQHSVSLDKSPLQRPQDPPLLPAVHSRNLHSIPGEVE